MPAIELKSIRVNNALSEETNCYSATLYVDGRKYGVVGNDGHGGSDRILELAKGVTFADFKALDAAIFAERGMCDLGSGLQTEYDLELVCGELVAAFLLEKEVAKLLKKNVLFIAPTEKKVRGYKITAQHTPEAITTHVKKTVPTATILNELSLAEAAKLYEANT